MHKGETLVAQGETLKMNLNFSLKNERYFARVIFNVVSNYKENQYNSTYAVISLYEGREKMLKNDVFLVHLMKNYPMTYTSFLMSFDIGR